MDTAIRVLSAHPVLLILDNLEQLVEQGAVLDDLTTLLDRVEGLTVLATSRTVLHLRGEHVLDLAPLPLPEAGTDTDPEEVLRSEAVQLVRDRARAVLPGFEVTADNAADVAGVIRMLDGLPLALELAAARVRTLPPGQMLRRVDRRLRLLTGGPRDLPDRHRSMRAALDWSAQLLGPVERRVFAQLSVFAGGWTIEAAEAVCDPGDDSDEEVIDVLERLVDRSLVVSDGSARMTLLETVREYAAGLPEAADRRIRDRHADHYAALTEELGPGWRTAGLAQRLLLDDEAGNIAAALAHCAAVGDGVLLSRFVLALLDYWWFSGRSALIERWLPPARDAVVPPDLRAMLLLSEAHLCLERGDPRAACRIYDTALREADDLRDDLIRSRILSGRGVAHRFTGAIEAAVEDLTEAREAARAAGDEARVFWLGSELGELHAELGMVERAVPAFEEFRRWATGQHADDDLGYALANLAFAADESGDAERASGLMAAAEWAARATDSLPDRAVVLGYAGLLALRQAGGPADAERAAGLLRTAVELHHDTGQLICMPELVCLLGVAQHRAGRSETGARILATGNGWAAARGIRPGRLARQLIDETERELVREVPTARLTAARAMGSLVRFGSLGGLDELTRAEPVGRSLDLREPEDRHGPPTVRGGLIPSGRHRGDDPLLSAAKPHQGDPPSQM